MGKSLVLCAALLCLPLLTLAQDSPAAFEASTATASESAAAAPASLIPPDREPWQLGVGFQYMNFNVVAGQRFSDYGYQADVTRYLNNWFGVEGATEVGFGHVAPSIDAKSFFIGGGPHISLHDSSRLEPWVHVLVGWERFRFTQTTTLGVSSHAAFWGGGGLDYKIGGGHVYWRVQADFIGTNVGTGINGNYAVGTGFILNF
jgi:hypothetical protein